VGTVRREASANEVVAEAPAKSKAAAVSPIEEALAKLEENNPKRNNRKFGPLGENKSPKLSWEQMKIPGEGQYTTLKLSKEGMAGATELCEALNSKLPKGPDGKPVAKIITTPDGPVLAVRQPSGNNKNAGKFELTLEGAMKEVRVEARTAAIAEVKVVTSAEVTAVRAPAEVVPTEVTAVRAPAEVVPTEVTAVRAPAEVVPTEVTAVKAPAKATGIPLAEVAVVAGATTAAMTGGEPSGKTPAAAGPAKPTVKVRAPRTGISQANTEIGANAGGSGVMVWMGASELIEGYKHGDAFHMGMGAANTSIGLAGLGSEGVAALRIARATKLGTQAVARAADAGKAGTALSKTLATATAPATGEAAVAAKLAANTRLAGKGILTASSTAEDVALVTKATTRIGKVGRMAGHAAIPLAVVASGYEAYHEEGSSIKEHKLAYKGARFATGMAALGAATQAGKACSYIPHPGLKIAAMIVVPLVVAGVTSNAGGAIIDSAKARDNNNFVAASDTFENLKEVSQKIIEKYSKTELMMRGAEFTKGGKLDMANAPTRKLILAEIKRMKGEAGMEVKANDYSIGMFTGNDKVTAYKEARNKVARLDAAISELETFSKQAGIFANPEVEKAAAAKAERKQAAFARLDKNGDGKIDAKDLDRNGDGQITQADYANKDGKIDAKSIEEMNKDLAALKELSENSPELAKIYEGMKKIVSESERELAILEKAVAAGQAQPAPMSDKEKAAKQARKKAAFARLDKNGDGKLDASDFDRDGDGKISLKDFANKDGKVGRKELAEMQKDIEALNELAEYNEQLAKVRDDVKKMAETAELELAVQEQEVANVAAVENTRQIAAAQVTPAGPAISGSVSGPDMETGRQAATVVASAVDHAGDHAPVRLAVREAAAAQSTQMAPVAGGNNRGAAGRGV